MDEAGLFVEADAGDVGAVDFGDEAMAIEFDSAGEERPEESSTVMSLSRSQRA